MNDCLLNTIVGGFLFLICATVLWACKSALRKHNSAVAVEPFKCPRCGYTELVISAERI